MDHCGFPLHRAWVVLRNKHLPRQIPKFWVEETDVCLHCGWHVGTRSRLLSIHGSKEEAEEAAAKRTPVYS